MRCRWIAIKSPKLTDRTDPVSAGWTRIRIEAVTESVAPAEDDQAFSARLPITGLDQLQTQVRELMPERSRASSLPVVFSRQISAGASGEGRCLPVQSTPLEVVIKKFIADYEDGAAGHIVGKHAQFLPHVVSP